MTDEAFEVYTALHDALHEIINTAVKNLNEEDELDIRDKLADEFRFWRRINIKE